MFPWKSQHGSFEADSLGSLLSTVKVNEYVIALVNRGTELSFENWAYETTAIWKGNVLTDSEIVDYGVPSHVQVRYGVESAWNQFGAKCPILDLKTYPHDLKCPEHQKRQENSKMVTILRNYVAEKQWDWFENVLLLKYVYNSEVHKSTPTTLFKSVISQR